MKRETDHIEKAFEGFMRDVFPDAGANQRECLRDAFFGGALIAYQRIMQATDNRSSVDEALAHLADIHQELKGFGAEAEKRAIQATNEKWKDN